MSIRSLEQALTCVYFAAASVLFFQLWRQDLLSRFRYLSLLILIDVGGDLAWLLLGPTRRHLFSQIYFVGQAAEAVVGVLLVLDLFWTALKDHPALARFGRRLAGYLLMASLAGSVLVQFLGESRENRYQVLRYYFRAERTVEATSLVLLILLVGFLLWFPVHLHRNTLLYAGGVVCIFLSQWGGLFLIGYWPRLTATITLGMMTVSICCVTLWAAGFRREEAGPGMRPLWSPGRMKRLTAQLDTLNAKVQQMVR